jgi:Lysozyme like domain
MAAITAVAIALAEDPSGQTNILNDTPSTQDYSIGNWQINYLAHKDFGTPADLTNPATNAAAANILYNRRGGSFADWSTYINGAYLAHMPAATAAAVDADFGAVVGDLLKRIGDAPSGGVGPAPGSPSNPLPAPGTHANPASPGAPSVEDVLTAIGGVFAWFGVPGHWWAIALVAVGGGLVIFGAILYLRPEIEQAAGQVAKVAAVAA